MYFLLQLQCMDEKVCRFAGKIENTYHIAPLPIFPNCTCVKSRVFKIFIPLLYGCHSICVYYMPQYAQRSGAPVGRLPFEIQNTRCYVW